MFHCSCCAKNLVFSLAIIQLKNKTRFKKKLPGACKDFFLSDRFILTMFHLELTGCTLLSFQYYALIVRLFDINIASMKIKWYHLNEIESLELVSRARWSHNLIVGKVGYSFLEKYGMSNLIDSAFECIKWFIF